MRNKFPLPQCTTISATNTPPIAESFLYGLWCIASRMHPTFERYVWALWGVSVDGGIGPIGGGFNQTMFYRIVVNVFAMINEIPLISDAMFPIATLPKVAFPSPFTGWSFL